MAEAQEDLNLNLTSEMTLPQNMEMTDMSPSTREQPTPLSATPRGATFLRYNSEDVITKTEEMQPLQTSPLSMQASPSSTLPLTIQKNRRRPGSSSDGSKITMTGTVMQGSTSNDGQPFEVEVELSEKEFHRLTSRELRTKRNDPCTCGRKQGPHIILWSFLCVPVAFIISLFLSFYNGSIAWYNIFIYLSEEKSLIHRLTLSPLLILSFPVTVGLSTFCIALVASVLQISWYWIRWKVEILDGEKGFYGLMCNKLRLPDCSPYQVVILEESGF